MPEGQRGHVPGVAAASALGNPVGTFVLVSAARAASFRARAPTTHFVSAAIGEGFTLTLKTVGEPLS